MQNINDKIEQLAKQLGKPVVSGPVDDYQSIRQEYQALANRDVQEQQRNSKKQRIEDIYGRSDLNPKWIFDNIVQDSPDVIEAINIAQSFIAAHSDPNWRKNSANMMIFYGDYGRGKSHIAGAIAQELINEYEISVLYRQLSSLLEMRFFSYDYSAQDSIGEKFRQTQQELLDVDLLILDEVCVNETVLKKNTQSWLGNLLRQRLADNKNCILITNHNLSGLENALGRYCYESIKEYDTYKVCFSGPSRRENVSDDEIAESSNDEVATSYIHKSGYVPNQVK
jgi:DNA replication protein DnaC